MRDCMAAVDTGRGRGAIQLAVCRGTISERIDFEDKHGRCVMLTGIPHQSCFELKVYLQGQAFDNAWCAHY